MFLSIMNKNSVYYESKKDNRIKDSQKIVLSLKSNLSETHKINIAK